MLPNSGRIVLPAIAMLLVPSLAHNAGAQDRTSRVGSLAGIVVDASTRTPLLDALVQIIGRDSASVALAVRTDDRGQFRFAGVARAAYRLRVRRLGFAPKDTTVDVAPESPSLVFSLTRNIVQLDAAVIRGGSDARAEFDTLPSAGVLRVPAEALRAAPAVLEADLFRTVQTLPGVVARSDRTAGLNVQGGESDQNLTLLDGIPIFNPDHFGGVFGAFIDGAVGSARFEGSGFGARLDGRLSSVLDVASATPERGGVHGAADLSLLSSSVTLGGTVAGSNGTWGLGLRRTYVDLLSRMISSRALPYHFVDAQAHATYTLPGGIRAAASGYTGEDVLDATMAQLDDSVESGSGHLTFDRGNDAAGLSLARTFAGPAGFLGDSLVLEQAISRSRYTSRYDQGAGSLLFQSGVRETRVHGLAARYQGAHVLRAGYEVDADRVTYGLGSTQLASADLSGNQRLTTTGLFAEDEWRVSNRLSVRPGLRYDRAPAARWSGLEPRLSARYTLTPDMAVTAAGGRYAQWMHFSVDERAPLQLFDYWVASDRSVPVSTADAGTLGVERWLGRGRSASVEGFYKRYHDLATPNLAADPDVPTSAFSRESGRSYGATVGVRQEEIGGAGGWLSYTYALASRRRGDLTYSPLQDRRHTVNAVVTRRVGSYSTSMHFGYGSGTPYTAVVGELQQRLYDPATGTWTPGDPLPVRGAYNAARYPAYSRLDLGISRDFTVGGAILSPSLSVANVYNAHNVFGYISHFDTNPPTRRAIPQLPILPSLGLRIDF